MRKEHWTRSLETCSLTLPQSLLICEVIPGSTMVSRDVKKKERAFKLSHQE